MTGGADPIERVAQVALASDTSTLMPDTARSLLITLEYPQHEMDGPPFSVSEKEIFRLYGSQFLVELLFSVDCLANEPRFQQRGLSRLDEHVFLLARNIS